jgi:hypothetical protein
MRVAPRATSLPPDMKPAHITDPRLQHILQSWAPRRRDGLPPRRADITPAELGPAQLRHLNIVEVVREPGMPLAFRHRLVGTYNIEWLGRDSTGKMLDEKLYGAMAPAIIASFTRIVEEAKPFYRVVRMDWHDKRHLMNESVDLPLSDENHAVAMILRGAIFRHATDMDCGSERFEVIDI